MGRWEHEAVLEAMEDRVDRKSDCMRIRGSTVEHPFGTIKSWLGPTHFQMKRLDHVSTEMSLHVLSYNLKRMLQMFGVGPLMAAIKGLGSSLLRSIISDLTPSVIDSQQQ